ncbi:MAG: glycosyltransferase family 4 protein [Candidatus Binatia bacterium]
MRVGVDVRKIRDGGIGVYVGETLGALATLAPDVELVAFGDPADRERLPARVEWVETRAGKYSIAEHVIVARAAHAAGVDLFHSPHYVLPLFLRTPAVVTVHDLIHLLLPRSPLHAIYARAMIGAACRRAARVIVVSERTGADLRARFPSAADKVRVIPNGVSGAFRAAPRTDVDRVLAALGVEPPYVLFVSNRLPHKNVENALRGFARLPAPRPRLVLCGAGYEEGSPVWPLADELGVRAELRAVGALETERLVALYSGAAALLSTSLYEGFGLPLVEAMACGVPVVAPDAGAVPEVVGDAAILVAPRRVDSIGDGLYRILNDAVLRERLIARGIERAGRFSWVAAAGRTLAVYREILTSDGERR